MALDNYRDQSILTGDLSSGFKFEFYCSVCSRKWASAFKPYRMGQISNLISMLSQFLPGSVEASRVAGGLNSGRMSAAHAEALEQARQQAAQRYQECSSCHQGVCLDCLDPRSGQCKNCQKAQQGDRAGSSGSAATGAACPNCGTSGSGGRFCAECGFDMASTHKSCPGCGAMQPRQARFCTDCGHGF